MVVSLKIPNGITMIKNWKSALERLKTGNVNFVNDSLQNNFQDSTRRKYVFTAQTPFTAILTCSDSRVVPELIFDAGIGELFVIRVAGNVANTSSIASIEYAISHLGVKLIIVLGHQNWGAVKSALTSSDNGKNLNHLLKFIQPAISASSERKKVDDIAHMHVRLTSEKLVKDSIILSQAVVNNLKIAPAFYNLETGKADFIE